MGPLQSRLLRETDRRFAAEYGVKGAGGLVTTVIRAVKAWSKGLPAAAAAAAAAERASLQPGTAVQSQQQVVEEQPSEI